MRTFRFPLQRVLELRRTQLELEQARYRQCLAAVASLDHAMAELEAAGIQAEVQVRQYSPVTGKDLAALSTFRGTVRTKEKVIALRRADAIRKAQSQMELLLESQRRCRLLERLRESRLGEWRKEEDRDLEQMATESYLARRTREHR